MALFRRFFYRKPPDGLLEITERVYVFDSCFTTDVFDDDTYKIYVRQIATQLHEQFPDSSFLVFNFREGERKSQLTDIVSQYDMTVMDYPRQYEGCPILSLEMIHHFLRSSDSWISLDGDHNIVLMHCERGGWPTLAFMLAGFLIYKELHAGEQRTLEMLHREAPRGLMQLLSPLNPMPSQLRYLQYISRRNISPEWPPPDRALSLDCLILRVVPSFDTGGGCRPIVRIYGRQPGGKGGRATQTLFATEKKKKSVRHFRQVDCDVVKIDVQCGVQGDVVLECIHVDADLEREEMIFRVMFNTSFIRSNILMLNRDEIDLLWDAKERFTKDFRAEVLFMDTDTLCSPKIPVATLGGEEKGGLPIEAFAKVQELFTNVDWTDNSKGEAALRFLQQMSAVNGFAENVGKILPENQNSLLAPQSGQTARDEKTYQVTGSNSLLRKSDLTTLPSEQIARENQSERKSPPSSSPLPGHLALSLDDEEYSTSPASDKSIPHPPPSVSSIPVVRDALSPPPQTPLPSVAIPVTPPPPPPPLPPSGQGVSSSFPLPSGKGPLPLLPPLPSLPALGQGAPPPPPPLP
eukprot:c12305_g1_i1 orf=3-1730(-)